MVELMPHTKRVTTDTVGFEPTRITPSDFKSDALTTRPCVHKQTQSADPRYMNHRYRHDPNTHSRCFEQLTTLPRRDAFPNSLSVLLC